MTKKYKRLTEEILELAEVKINRCIPWNIWIHNDELYKEQLQKVNQAWVNPIWITGRILKKLMN